MEYNQLILKENETSDNIIKISKERLLEKGKISFCSNWIKDSANGLCMMELRGMGKFSDTSFWLNPVYEWVLGVDEEDNLCLVPLKKEK